jgi:hypothetical protein
MCGIVTAILDAFWKNPNARRGLHIIRNQRSRLFGLNALGESRGGTRAKIFGELLDPCNFRRDFLSMSFSSLYRVRERVNACNGSQTLEFERVEKENAG